jgi:predicted alpha/beta-hydrolase family hydrolase
MGCQSPKIALIEHPNRPRSTLSQSISASISASAAALSHNAMAFKRPGGMRQVDDARAHRAVRYVRYALNLTYGAASFANATPRRFTIEPERGNETHAGDDDRFGEQMTHGQARAPIAVRGNSRGGKYRSLLLGV